MNNLLTTAIKCAQPYQTTPHCPPNMGRPALCVCPNRRWYVVEAEPNRLERAVNTLKKHNFNTYVPMVLVSTRLRHNGQRDTTPTPVPKPMLFGFFFVSLDLDIDPWGFIRRERNNGIARMLTDYAGQPVRADRGGGISVEMLMAGEPERLKVPGKKMQICKVGDMALFHSGPFAGTIGEVERCDGFHTEVWIAALGGRVKVISKRSDLTVE